MVERFLEDYDIEAVHINIDLDAEARQELILLNGGYASVPTLLFPDGSKLTEPSLKSLRRKLDLESPGFMEQIRALFGASEK